MAINWNIWARCKALPLHQAAALLAGVAPEKVNARPPFVRATAHAHLVATSLRQAGIPRPVPNSPVSYGEFHRRQVDEAATANENVRGVFIVAKSAVAEGSLKLLSNGWVALSHFVAWAHSEDLAVPEELSGLLPSASVSRKELGRMRGNKNAGAAGTLVGSNDETLRSWRSVGEYLKKRFGLARAPDPKTMKDWLDGRWTKDGRTPVVLKGVLDALPVPPSLK